MLTIQALSPALSNAYFDFFEHRAFTDNSPYRCYCQVFQMTQAQYNAAYDNAAATDLGALSRTIAEEQIASGVLRGYLAFVDGVSIGWCNVNDKAGYPADAVYGERFHAPAERREKAVACFEIAPEFRGKGVATALLRRAVADAKAEGYLAIEGFPVPREERYEWEYSGPVRLYEKEGFVRVAEKAEYWVMRKELR